MDEENQISQGGIDGEQLPLNEYRLGCGEDREIRKPNKAEQKVKQFQ
ncbi:MAG: hypothetical protein JNN07_21305 [Verrucomicrobiales bacterium]|nr:hypothetical protein [Verrucomicrobiales bacterium]